MQPDIIGYHAADAFRNVSPLNLWRLLRRRKNAKKPALAERQNGLDGKSARKKLRQMKKSAALWKNGGADETESAT